MEILLIWEQHPEATSFHRLKMTPEAGQELLSLHGKFLGEEDLTLTDARLIERVMHTKGPSLEKLEISGVTHFVQTGVLL